MKPQNCSISRHILNPIPIRGLNIPYFPTSQLASQVDPRLRLLVCKEEKETRIYSLFAEVNRLIESLLGSNPVEAWQGNPQSEALEVSRTGGQWTGGQYSWRSVQLEVSGTGGQQNWRLISKSPAIWHLKQLTQFTILCERCVMCSVR